MTETVLLIIILVLIAEVIKYIKKALFITQTFIIESKNRI